MSTWNVAGQNSDLTSSIHAKIKTLLDSAARWTESTVGHGNIKFSTNWYDGNGKQYQVACLSRAYTRRPITNDWRKYEYKHQVDIHIFVNAISEDEPAALLAMQQQAEKIISQNRTSLGEGVTLGSITSFEKADEPERGTKSFWHTFATVEVLYFKVDSS